MILYVTQHEDEADSTQPPAPTSTIEAQVDLDQVIGVLMAATQALFVAYEFEPTHYEAYYRYRATKLEGYAPLYDHFALTVDTAAQDLGQSSFVTSDRATRRTILDSGLQHIINNDFHDETGNILADAPTWEHYARFILREMMLLFMYTDAWVAIGYDGWPGMTRGLERYRQPLAVAESQIVG